MTLKSVDGLTAGVGDRPARVLLIGIGLLVCLGSSTGCMTARVWEGHDAKDPVVPVALLKASLIHADAQGRLVADPAAGREVLAIRVRGADGRSHDRFAWTDTGRELPEGAVELDRITSDPRLRLRRDPYPDSDLDPPWSCEIGVYEGERLVRRIPFIVYVPRGGNLDRIVLTPFVLAGDAAILPFSLIGLYLYLDWHS